MRIPCHLRNFRAPAHRPVKPFDEIATALAFIALIGAAIAAIGIMIATGTP